MGVGEPVCAKPAGSRELFGRTSMSMESMFACECACIGPPAGMCLCPHQPQASTSSDAVRTSSSSDQHSSLRGEAGWDSMPILELR